jgi:TATA-box binding protein (TBP) (component of TFIID and TFIIIB)
MNDLKLSTMTVIYTTNMIIDIKLLSQLIPINDDIIKVEKSNFIKRGLSSSDRIKHRNKPTTNTKTTGFCRNSMSVVIMNSGDDLLRKEITVRIFQNGLFHITGVLHESYDRNVMDILLKIMLSPEYEIAIRIPEIFTISRKVVLMNYSTSLKTRELVKREKLFNDILNLNLGNVKLKYNPDVYPGIQIRFTDSKMSANIFRTGKITMSGITTAEESIDLRDNLDSIFVRVLPDYV